MKIGIGTAQFGLDYGISNQEGKTTPEEVVKILEVAAQNGVCVIDTSPAYGTSETVLGKILPPHFDIITKTPYLNKPSLTLDDAQYLEDSFYQSLSNLNQPFIYGLLIHHVADVLAEGGDLLMQRMLKLKQEGLVKKVGVSIYTGEEIDQVLQNYSIDLVQVPINVLDQRLLASGHLQKLKEMGVEIHARSIFLQGLLLMKPAALPPHFDSVRETLKNYHDLLTQQNISPVQAALSFIKNLNEIDVVLLGMNNSQQLKEILLEMKNSEGIKTDFFYEFAQEDSLIINPSKWKI